MNPQWHRGGWAVVVALTSLLLLPIQGAPAQPAGRDSPPARAEQPLDLLKQALALEAEGKFAEALPIWVQLANFPQTALAARQHRIWILLRAEPGQAAPTRANIDGATQLIAGPLAAEDPILFEEHLALASAIMSSAAASLEELQALYGEAVMHLRHVTEGVPGVGERKAPDHVLRIAEWNLAALAVHRPVASDTDTWERALAAFAPHPGREALRLLMAMRLAEAYLVANRPADVQRALTMAENIAAGREGAGTRALVSGDEQLRSFRRYLARLAVERKVAEQYRDTLFRLTDFGAAARAAEASDLSRAFAQNLAMRPETIGDAPTAWQTILQRLQEARVMAAGSAGLERRLDADIQAVQAFLTALQTTPPGIFYRWNLAANRTNTARTAQEWDEAAQMWRDVLAQMEGRPAEERAEAAAHVENALFRKADVLFAAGDKPAAKVALDQARTTMMTEAAGSVGTHLVAGSREVFTRRIENNVRAIEPEERLFPAATVEVPAYRGGSIGPCRAACVIIHYSEKHTPDVAAWLDRLQNDPDAIRRLVDWFNNGPMARKTPGAKRDFSADPNSPDYLVSFLSKWIHRSPGPLARGTRQWCDHNGAGPWHSYPVAADTAAYYLTNGTAIINADCSNPLASIRAEELTAAWMETVESAAPRVLPQAPAIAYAAPQADFPFPLAAALPYTMPLPAVTVVEIERGRDSPERGRDSPERGRDSPRRDENGAGSEVKASPPPPAATMLLPVYRRIGVSK